MDDTPSIEDLLKTTRPPDDTSASDTSAPGRFEARMRDIGVKEQERNASRHAVDIGIPYMTLRGFPITEESLTVIPEEKAKALKIICFFASKEGIKLGAVDPENPDVVAEAKRISGERKTTVAMHLISDASFQWALKAYAHVAKVRHVDTGVDISAEKIQEYQERIKSFSDLQQTFVSESLTEIFAIVLSSAIKFEASDIHIEAEQDSVKIRYRIDGILYDVAKLPPDQWNRIISRIKLVAGMKINVTTIPQDGRITIKYGDEKIDVRLNTVPTSYGESVAMRLLRGTATKLVLKDLGLWGDAYHLLKQEVQRPNGMVIITGPTGSGKTTTLYALLTTLNTPDTKIITLEDPIEYRLQGINQSQVNDSRGYSFATGLRALMRQDPDIVMVGEIRDGETADIAVQAALTGHLVFSTIHTNSAAGAIPRFLSMDVKPFLLAPALNAIVAQRLVRTICTHCKAPADSTPEQRARVVELLGSLKGRKGIEVDVSAPAFFKGTGCDTCNNLGYKGRIGIFEVMVVTKEIENAILSGAVSEYQMHELAQKQGMVSMAQDGLIKALHGVTTIDEVFRVAE